MGNDSPKTNQTNCNHNSEKNPMKRTNIQIVNPILNNNTNLNIKDFIFRREIGRVVLE